MGAGIRRASRLYVIRAPNHAKPGGDANSCDTPVTFRTIGEEGRGETKLCCASKVNRSAKNLSHTCRTLRNLRHAFRTGNFIFFAHRPNRSHVGGDTSCFFRPA